MTRPLIQLAEVDLGRQRSPEHERGNFMIKYLRSANVGDGVLVLDDVKEMNFSPLEQARFALRAGDVVVTEGSGSRDTVGQSAVWRDEIPGVVCFQNTLLRIRPRVGLADGRFLAWWARHAHASRLMAAVASGANILHLGAEELRRLPVPNLGLSAQRRIADFLDDQVARIDNIIDDRTLQRRLFAERSASLLQEVLTDLGCVLAAGTGIDGYRHNLPNGWRAAELGHVLRQLTNGYVGPTRELLVDDGVRYIQSLHIKNGRINFSRRPYFVPRAWHLERPRIHLRPEDVLIVQTGDIGQVAVVPEDIGEASCHALLIARTEPGVVTGSFLGEYLRSPIGRQELLSRATGALHPHLESGIKAAPIVVPPLEIQTQAVKEIRGHRQDLESLDHALENSSGKLAELKRSLITAAVTGEFDVSSADGSRVPA